MSTDLCKLCNKESTPWVHIDGHICEDCYHNCKGNKWIRVKDKLPLYKQVVLVFLDTKEITEAVYRGEYEEDVHIFRIELTREDIENKINYWMPLPEPPNEV